MGCGLQVGSNGRAVDAGRAPLRSRTTWAGDDMMGAGGAAGDPADKQRISRRKTVGQQLEIARDDSPDGGNFHLSVDAPKPLLVVHFESALPHFCFQRGVRQMKRLV